jgi:hypothetical protein
VGSEVFDGGVIPVTVAVGAESADADSPPLVAVTRT